VFCLFWTVSFALSYEEELVKLWVFSFIVAELQDLFVYAPLKQFFGYILLPSLIRSEALPHKFRGRLKPWTSTAILFRYNADIVTLCPGLERFFPTIADMKAKARTQNQARRSIHLELHKRKDAKVEAEAEATSAALSPKHCEVNLGQDTPDEDTGKTLLSHKKREVMFDYAQRGAGKSFYEKVDQRDADDDVDYDKAIDDLHEMQKKTSPGINLVLCLFSVFLVLPEEAQDIALDQFFPVCIGLFIIFVDLDVPGEVFELAAQCILVIAITLLLMAIAGYIESQNTKSLQHVVETEDNLKRRIEERGGVVIMGDADDPFTNLKMKRLSADFGVPNLPITLSRRPSMDGDTRRLSFVGLKNNLHLPATRDLFNRKHARGRGSKEDEPEEKGAAEDVVGKEVALGQVEPVVLGASPRRASRAPDLKSAHRSTSFRPSPRMRTTSCGRGGGNASPADPAGPAAPSLPPSPQPPFSSGPPPPTPKRKDSTSASRFLFNDEEQI